VGAKFTKAGDLLMFASRAGSNLLLPGTEEPAARPSVDVAVICLWTILGLSSALLVELSHPDAAMRTAERLGLD
jgi:hypothetical protein